MVSNKSVSKKDGSVRVKKFDPFTYSISENIGSGIDLTYENRFINLFDYSPIPLRNDLYVVVNEEVILRVAQNLMSHQPLNVIPLLIRFRSTTVIDKVIDRVSLFAFSDAIFEILEKTYITSFFEMINEIFEQEVSKVKQSNIQMINVLLTLISYMLPRLRGDSLNEIMNKVLKILNTDYAKSFWFSDIIAIVIQRIVSQMAYFCIENIDSINYYFNLPLPDAQLVNDPRLKYPNTHVAYIQFLDPIRDHIKIESKLINHLKRIADDAANPLKGSAILRLALYFEYGLANNSNIDEYSKILWDSIENDGTIKLYGLRAWIPFKYKPENLSIDKEDATYQKYKKKLMDMDLKSFLKVPKSIGGSTILEMLVNALLDICEWFGNENDIKKTSWTFEESDLLLLKIVSAWKEVRKDIIEIKNLQLSFGYWSMKKQYERLFYFCNVCIFPKIGNWEKYSADFIDIYSVLSKIKIFLPEILLCSYEHNKNLIMSLLHSINRIEQNSVIKAIIYWIGWQVEATDESMQLLDEVIDIIQYRRQPGLFKALDKVRYMFSKRPALFTNEMIDKLLFGLARLEKETRILNTYDYLQDDYVNNIAIAELPDYRALTSMFIKQIFRHDGLNDEQEKIIDELKGIFLEDHFPEVQIPWLIEL